MIGNVHVESGKPWKTKQAGWWTQCTRQPAEVTECTISAHHPINGGTSILEFHQEEYAHTQAQVVVASAPVYEANAWLSSSLFALCGNNTIRVIKAIKYQDKEGTRKPFELRLVKKDGHSARWQPSDYKWLNKYIPPFYPDQTHLVISTAKTINAKPFCLFMLKKKHCLCRSRYRLKSYRLPWGF